MTADTEPLRCLSYCAVLVGVLMKHQYVTSWETESSETFHFEYKGKLQSKRTFVQKVTKIFGLFIYWCVYACLFFKVTAIQLFPTPKYIMLLLRQPKYKNIPDFSSISEATTPWKLNVFFSAVLSQGIWISLQEPQHQGTALLLLNAIHAQQCWTFSNHAEL